MTQLLETGAVADLVDGARPIQRERASTGVGHVAIVGLGYVGLPTALALHARGIPVIGIDLSLERLDAIRAGDVDLGLEDRERLAGALCSDDFTLAATSSSVRDADAVVICVPTPIDAHFLPDLSILRAACTSVVRDVRPGQLVILTSTTYAGSTTDLLVRPLAQLRGLEAGSDVYVAFSPERINPGVETYAQGDVPRVVGGVTDECSRRAADLLRLISKNVHVVATPEAAELTKLFENTFRAVNISLANEFSRACGQLGVDVMEVLDAAATKPFGFMRFVPGPGVGGHCIPCDPHYLLWQLRRHGVRMPVVEAAMDGIAERPRAIAERVLRLLGAEGIAPSRARVAVVGVAYKPDVADVRESPALALVAHLHEAGVAVTPTDPHVRVLPLEDGTALECEALADLDIADYDLVVLHTKHGADDLTRLQAARRVLDATYQLRDLPQRVLP